MSICMCTAVGSGSEDRLLRLETAVTNRYKTPNLVRGDPEGGPRRLRCICAWGGAPSPLAPRTARSPLKKQAKSHSGPLQPRPTHTPSRRCAPCSLACFHFFFREVPLLSRPRPAQPLLLTADSAGSSVFLSPIGVTIAAARPCMFIAECVSAKNACVSGLCQVRCLHMLIAAIM